MANERPPLTRVSLPSNARTRSIARPPAQRDHVHGRLARTNSRCSTRSMAGEAVLIVAVAEEHDRLVGEARAVQSERVNDGVEQRRPTEGPRQPVDRPREHGPVVLLTR